jgi:hypothetical protein
MNGRASGQQEGRARIGTATQQQAPATFWTGVTDVHLHGQAATIMLNAKDDHE